MHALSDRQRRIMDFIGRYARQHGYPPTIREIGQAAGITSTSVVDYNLKVLEREGLLKRDPEVSRGLGLSAAAPERQIAARTRIPIVGLIAAGEPIEAVQGHPEELDVAGRLCDDGCYALKVKGKSMIEDLIDDGDIVVVRPQETAADGEIVVALITEGPTEEGRATLKRLYREQDRIRLQPANSEMQPIYVDPRDLLIQGKVVSVIRQL
ncbi:MAG TPA: transcriptional repressor LexA [Chloroflexota bacterium]